MNFREHSKQNFESDKTVEHINAGSLQRIADATELMAKNYTNLQNDVDRYRGWYKEGREEIDRLNKRISGLKGVITKMKNKSLP